MPAGSLKARLQGQISYAAPGPDGVLEGMTGGNMRKYIILSVSEPLLILHNKGIGRL